MTPTEIPVAAISVSANRRKVDPAWVATLKELIEVQGLMQPIEVVSEGDAFALTFGAHRLEAVTQLGRSHISAFVKDPAAFASEADRELREISENLIRRQLSVLDKSRDIARWRDIYEAANRTAKPGRKRSARTPEQEDELSANFALNFSEAAQQALGISRRSVFLALKIASIAASVRDRLSLHAIADNQSELLLLAAEPADRQELIAGLLTTGPMVVTSVADAIAVIDRVPAKPRTESWEKVSSAFSGLKPTEQDRFFTLHEAAVTRWLQSRSGGSQR